MANPFGEESIIARAPKAGGNPFGTESLLRPLASPAPANVVKSIEDALKYGLQDTGFVRWMRDGKGPTKEMPDDAPWQYRLARGVGSVAGDFVPSVIGALPGVATANPITAMAGGFAAPMALREAVVEAYANGHAFDISGVLEVGKAALKGGTKGAIIGAATGGVGKVLAPTLGTSVKGAVALTGAEVATMTTVSSALEGQVPKWQDFMDNAILLGGTKAAIGTAKAMYRTYAETGKTPAEVRADAQRDPALKKALAEGGDKLPATYEPLAVQERIKAALAADPRPEMVAKILADPDWKPTANEPPPVRIDYLVDRETLAGVAGEVGRIYAKDIEAATRGKVSNKATLADGLELVKDGIKPHEVGQAAAASEAVGRAVIAKSAQMEALQARADALANPADISAQLRFLHSIEVMAATQRDFTAITSEWGRTGQILKRIKYDVDFLPDAIATLEAYKKGTPLGEVMAAFGRLDGTHAQMRFAKTFAETTGPAKFFTAWRAGIFSGPLTWQANILGNTGKWAMDLIEKPTAALYEAALSKEPIVAANLKARALSPLYGMQLAVLDGLKLVKETTALIEAHGVKKGAAMAKAQYDLRTQGYEGKIDARPDMLRTDAPSIGERAAARFTNFSFGMLKAQDLPFRTIGERAKAYELAVERATKETRYHPSTAEWKQAVARFVDDPTQGLPAAKALEVKAAIEAAGDAQVFAQPLGPKLSAVSNAIAGTPWDLVFPARRTPVNLLDWAVQRTPGLNLMSSKWRADFEAGGPRRAEALARVTVGTALAATAYWLASEGLFTGGNLADPETSATKEGARIPRYSIKVGDEYYSIARIEPIAKPMMLIADLIEISQSKKLTEEDAGKAVALTVLAFANATVSTTYLSGLSDLMRATTEPARFGEALVEGYATTLIPKIIGQPATIMDPYKREVDGVFDAIQSQMPYLREKLAPKIDIWGSLTENERLFRVTPIATAKMSEDKVKTEAVRLELGITRAPKYIEERTPLKPMQERTKLTPAQRSVLQEVTGTYALQELSRIVSQPAWDKLPDYAQAALYKKVIERAQTIGKNQALSPDSPERVAKRKEAWEEVLRQNEAAKAR